MYSGEIRDWPKRVRFGIDSTDALGGLMDSMAAHRAVVVCGSTVAGGPMLARVKDALGSRFAGVFSEIHSHTPFEDVLAASKFAQNIGADTIVSVGGGSAIDAGKGVVLLSSAGAPLDGDHSSLAAIMQPYAIEWGKKGSMDRQALGESRIRHISVPTTAGSASDVMPTAGIRDPKLPKKMLFWDDRLVPDATILDPKMAVHANPELTAATGMTAVARAIESLYSLHRHPISIGLALHAARLLRTALPRSVEDGSDLAARADCQMACIMSGTASINAMVSVVHAIGHVVGGRYGLQHGISHAILLGPAIRRLLPAIGADYGYVLEALGCPPASTAEAAADAAASALSRLLGQLPLPQRLREVGVTDKDLAPIAAATMSDYMMANLPAPMSSGDVESLLREAW